ncbi:ROK family transcriptional regulator, partial [Streptomyces asoensis]|uniref:ROK family transcriptional regulator n=1 Tax=Streptomyces asoensis TaxID=249586 RepID=UPI0033E6EBA5
MAAGTGGSPDPAPGVPGERPAGVNLFALRSHNAALVLDLLRTAGPDGISRLELAERTGLTPQAVSKITARLREEGLVAEAGRRASTGGKPRTVLRLVPEAGHAVGVHLDRDELRVVLADLDGRVVAERRVALSLGAGAGTVLGAVVRRVTEVVEDHAVASTLLGAGVALPGPLDHVRGVLHRVTGFPEWDGFALRDALAARLGVPVVVDKDTNAAALGLAVGGERGSFACLHLGTGLGAGLVIGGSVHRGTRTGAGEFGHQVIQLDGPPCPCGNQGCVEALCLAAIDRGAHGPGHLHRPGLPQRDDMDLHMPGAVLPRP